MVRTFYIYTLVLLTAPAALAQDAPEQAELFAGVTTRWSREALAVDDFDDTPDQMPARTASRIDAGSDFRWTTAALTFEFGARGGEQLEWNCVAFAGPATLQLSEAVEGGPRTVAGSEGDGIAGGLSGGGRYRLGESGWWIGGSYTLGLGYTALDNATLFGGTPIEGTARWLRHDVALRVGFDVTDRWSIHAGGSLVWTQLSTEWELAFDVPMVSRDTDAAFTTRWPARWGAGLEWRTADDGAVVLLEFSAGRLPTDLAVKLRLTVKL